MRNPEVVINKDLIKLYRAVNTFTSSSLDPGKVKSVQRVSRADVDAITDYPRINKTPLGNLEWSEFFFEFRYSWQNLEAKLENGHRKLIVPIQHVSYETVLLTRFTDVGSKA